MAKISPKSTDVRPRQFLREAAFFVLDILYNALVIIVLVVLIRSLLISPFRVIGSSMADTLQSNEFILIDKLSYRLDEPRRGDPVVFRPPITNKYPHKFEEAVILDARGNGELPLDSLQTPKPVIYCQNRLVQAFWFCQEKVGAGDLIFSLPYAAGQPLSESAWQQAAFATVSDEDVARGKLLFSGAPDRAYRVRIYDDAGPEYFVKRIVGIPGDTLKIENGQVYLKTAGTDDFIALEEPYLNAENSRHTYFNQHVGVNTFTVPDDQYFVLGDNRNHSNDSRSWFSPITEDHTPFVARRNLSGKVLVVLWPPAELQVLPAGALE